MMYDERFVTPMREELTRLGIEELRTAAAVDEARATYIAVVRSGFLRHFSIDEMQDLASLLARPL